MRYHLPLLVFFKSHTHTYIYYSGAHETEFTGHSVWSHDANVILERESHLKLMTMGLVQTCSYVIKQMQTKVTIDINKFLEAFSMEADGHCIHSPLWTQSEHNSASIRPHTPMVQSNLSSSMSTCNLDMDDYHTSHQAEAICWINLQEKRSCLQPTTAEEYQHLREAVTSDSGAFI